MNPLHDFRSGFRMSLVFFCLLVSAYEVQSAPIATLTLSPATSHVVAGLNRKFTAQARDAKGALLVPQPTFIFSASGGGDISPIGIYKSGNDAGGPHTITVSTEGLTASAEVFIDAEQTFSSMTIAPLFGKVASDNIKRLTATARDQNGDPMTAQPPFNWEVSGGGTIDETGLFMPSSGPGEQLTVTARSGSLSAISKLTITEPSVLTSILLNPPTVNINTGTTKPMNAIAKDQNGDALILQPSFTWSVSGGATIDAEGRVTAGEATGGPFTITAEIGDIRDASTLLVTQAEITKMTVAPLTTQIGVGDSKKFFVLLRDQYGLTVKPPVSLVWSVSGGGTISSSGLFVSDGHSTGDFTVTVALGDKSATATLSVVELNIKTISVSPGTGTLLVNGSKKFMAMAKDPFGQPLKDQPAFEWSVSGGGTISPNGVLTASNLSGGPYTVTATALGKSGSATFSITENAVFTSISLFPSTVVVASDNVRKFIATARDQNGTPLSEQPPMTWSITGGGTLSETGLFTAGGIPGGPFTLTVKSGDITQTASLTVSEASILTAITVLPPNPTLSLSGTLKFSAVGKDQNGDPMVTVPKVLWTVSEGGAISPEGLFTASSALPLSVTVTATAGAIQNQTILKLVEPVVTSVTLTPTNFYLHAGQTKTLSVTVRDQLGAVLPTPSSLAWTLLGNGTLSETGEFTASSTIGERNWIIATVDGKSDTAQIIVVSQQNMALNKTLTASSSLELPDWGIDKIVNGTRQSTDGDIGFSSDANLSADHSEWLLLDLGTSRSFDSLEIYPRSDAGHAGAFFPIDFTFEVSKDNISYTTVATYTGYKLSGTDVQAFKFAKTTARYLRITAQKLQNTAGVYRMQFAEIELYAAKNTVNAEAELENPLSQELSITPNPFNPTTRISLWLDKVGFAEVSVYNVRGMRIQTLLKGNQRPGLYRLQWNAKNESGHAVASGIYFLRVATAGKIRIQRMDLIR